MKYSDIEEKIQLKIPEGVDGWMASKKQQEYMFELGKRTSLAAEIGTYKGYSAAIVGLGMQNGYCKCRRCGFCGTYYCIDNYESTNKELVDTPQGVPTFEAFQDNINHFDLNDILIPIKGYSYEQHVWEQIPNGLDFIYIDGDHETKSVFQDIVLYSRKVKPDGLVLFHDIPWETVRAGINQGIDIGLIELVEEFDDFGVYRPLFSERF